MRTVKSSVSTVIVCELRSLLENSIFAKKKTQIGVSVKYCFASLVLFHLPLEPRSMSQREILLQIEAKEYTMLVGAT
jgi:hypothetical protein